jgi:hypothetical protein
MTVRPLIRICALAGGLAILVAAAGGASAQDGNVFQMLGITPAEEAEIDYRERPPLVVPPTRDLPQPTTFDPAAQTAWPRDPDRLRRERERREARLPRLEAGSPEDQREFMRREQRRKVRAAARGELRNDSVTCQLFGGCTDVTAPTRGVAAEGPAPRRTYLTDPPSDNLDPAPATGAN